MEGEIFRNEVIDDMIHKSKMDGDEKAFTK